MDVDVSGHEINPVHIECVVKTPNADASQPRFPDSTVRLHHDFLLEEKRPEGCKGYALELLAKRPGLGSLTFQATEVFKPIKGNEDAGYLHLSPSYASGVAMVVDKGTIVARVTDGLPETYKINKDGTYTYTEPKFQPK